MRTIGILALLTVLPLGLSQSHDYSASGASSNDFDHFEQDLSDGRFHAASSVQPHEQNDNAIQDSLPSVTDTTDQQQQSTDDALDLSLFDCQPLTGYFAHPTHLCSSGHVSCEDGQPLLVFCDGDQVFNPDSLNCQDRADVEECQAENKATVYPDSRHRYSPTTYAPPPQTSPLLQDEHLEEQTDEDFYCYGQPDGTLFSVEPCIRVYLECSNNKNKLRFCAENEVFNVDSGCVKREEVAECVQAASQTDCQDRDAPCSNADIQVAKPRSFCTGRPDGDYPTGKCIGYFVGCWKGQLTERVCPDGLVFDSQTRVCEHPTWVELCPKPSKLADSTGSGYGYTSDTRTTYAPTTTSEDIAQKCQEGTRTALGYCNEEFLICLHGQDVRKWCPRETVFDEKSSTCVYKMSVEACQPKTIMAAATEYSQCVSGDKQGQGYCNEQFLYCYKGQWISKWCPQETVFDSIAKTCTYKWKLTACMPKTTTTTTSTSSSYSAQCLEGSKHELGECLQQFNICHRGRYLRKWCPDGSIFRSNGQTCVQSSLVYECNPTTTYAPSASTRPKHCADGTKISLGDCSEEFIYCLNGQQLSKWCPQGTVFDSSEQTCVSKDKVYKCKQSHGGYGQDIFSLDYRPQPYRSHYYRQYRPGPGYSFYPSYGYGYGGHEAVDDYSYHVADHGHEEDEEEEGGEGEGDEEDEDEEEGDSYETEEKDYSSEGDKSGQRQTIYHYPARFYHHKHHLDPYAKYHFGYGHGSRYHVKDDDEERESGPCLGLDDGTKLTDIDCQERYIECFDDIVQYAVCASHMLWSERESECVPHYTCKLAASEDASDESAGYESSEEEGYEQEDEDYGYYSSPYRGHDRGIDLFKTHYYGDEGGHGYEPDYEQGYSEEDPYEGEDSEGSDEGYAAAHHVFSHNARLAHDDDNITDEKSTAITQSTSTATLSAVASTPSTTVNNNESMRSTSVTETTALSSDVTTDQLTESTTESGPLPREGTTETLLKVATETSLITDQSTEAATETSVFSDWFANTGEQDDVQEKSKWEQDGSRGKRSIKSGFGGRYTDDRDIYRQPYGYNHQSGYAQRGHYDPFFVRDHYSKAKHPAHERRGYMNPKHNIRMQMMAMDHEKQQQQSKTGFGAPIFPSSPPMTFLDSRHKRSPRIHSDDGDISSRDKRSYSSYDYSYRPRYGPSYGYGRGGSRGQDPFYARNQQKNVADYASVMTADKKLLQTKDLCAGRPDGFLHPLGTCSRDYCLCYNGKPFFQQCAEGDVFEPSQSRCVARSRSMSCNPSSTYAPPATTTNQLLPIMTDNPCYGRPDGYLHPLGHCVRDYCVCFNNKPIYQQCSEGQAFEEGGCVDASKCPTVPMTKPSNPCLDEKDGSLHPLARCTRDYCMCYGGKAIFQQCSEGDIFDPDLGRCFLEKYSRACTPCDESKVERDEQQKHPHPEPEPTAGSIVDTRSERERESPSAADETDQFGRFCGSQSTNGYYRHPTDCSKYVQCFNSLAFVFNCNVGMVFNVNKESGGGQCDFPFNVPDCAPSSSIDEMEEPLSGYGLPSNQVNEVNFDGHPGDNPSEFSNQDRIQPPIEGVFVNYGSGDNGQSQNRYVDANVVPDLPEQQQEYHPIEYGEVSESSARTDERCRGVIEGDKRASGRCRQDYLECREGRPVTRWCPSPGQAFDAATRRCLSSSQLPQCAQSDGARQDLFSDRYSHDRRGQESWQDLCLERTDGYYRHPSDCSRFVQCFHSTASLFDCASGLVFNARKAQGVCDFPVNVPECIFPSNNVGERDVDCEHRPDGAYFRDVNDCQMFYRCAHGRKLRFDCPADTVFNQRLNVCDYASNVPECANYNK